MERSANLSAVPTQVTVRSPTLAAKLAGDVSAGQGLLGKRFGNG
jgi:hypothetical protein